MALTGERACYNTVVTFGNQLLLLGTKSLHAVCIRTWMERLRHLTLQVEIKKLYHLTTNIHNVYIISIIFLETFSRSLGSGAFFLSGQGKSCCRFERLEATQKANSSGQSLPGFDAVYG